MLWDEKPVIEINIESAIKKGNNIQVLGPSQETLPALFDEYYKLMKNYVPPPPKKAPQKTAQGNSNISAAGQKSAAARKPSPKSQNMTTTQKSAA